MKAIRMFCECAFAETALGTQPGDPELHDTYVASLAPDAPTREEEVAAHGEGDYVEKAMTYFARTDDGRPCMMDYQVLGFLKSACQAMARIDDSKAKETRAYMKVMQDIVFVYPRRIPLAFKGGPGEMQRPLRANTAKGERTALAHSETVPAGAAFEFEILLLNPKYEGLVRELLAYAQFSGFGQWRNAGYGRANIKVADVREEEWGAA